MTELLDIELGLGSLVSSSWREFGELVALSVALFVVLIGSMFLVFASATGDPLTFYDWGLLLGLSVSGGVGFASIGVLQSHPNQLVRGIATLMPLILILVISVLN